MHRAILFGYMDVEIYLVEHILTRLPVEEHGNVK